MGHLLLNIFLIENFYTNKCGTGHGVGCFLNVHEGPQAIRWKYVEGSKETVLEPGMTITDEPGVYKAEQYGIRIENTLLVRSLGVTEDGEFLGFEPLTFVPIDLRAIDFKYLNDEDVAQVIWLIVLSSAMMSSIEKYTITKLIMCTNSQEKKY